MHATYQRRAAARALPATLNALSQHRGLTRISVAAICMAVIVAISQQTPTQATPTRQQPPVTSILPINLGAGVPSNRPIEISFERPMDPASTEAALAVLPTTSVSLAWSDDRTMLRVSPLRRWVTDRRYVVVVGAAARYADGEAVAAAQRYSFTTQTAPTVSSLQLRFPTDASGTRARALREGMEAGGVAPATPADTTTRISSRTNITIGFSAAMNRRDVASHFVISPQVRGRLAWEGDLLVFTPHLPLAPDARYAITVAGAHDRYGNPLGGDVSFSFTTRLAAQVLKATPASNAAGVADGRIVLWFSQPMAVESTRAALKVTDLTSGAVVTGTSAWNEESTQLRFTPSAALAPGHEFELRIGAGARDIDGNALTWLSTFTSKDPPPSPTPLIRAPSGPPPPADIQAFALWQINRARAQRELPALRLDAAITAVASAHAWEQIRNGYFGHIGLDGSTVRTRMARAGISFASSGENLCYLTQSPVRATLEWCQSVFMSEPYPGYANHIGNILGTRYSRVGIGIAQVGTKIIITWDFAG